MSDAEVLAQSRSEPAEFAVLFDRHFTTIYRYIARRVGRDGADDLAGEVFRIAFERRAAFDPRWRSARPWLYGIATNVLHGRNRSEQRRLRATQRASTAALVVTAGDEFDRIVERLDAETEAEQVARAVDQLTDGERDALLLFAVEGLSYGEVATVLDIPVGTVRSRINRARSRIRELLDTSGQEHPDRHEAEDDDG